MLKLNDVLECRRMMEYQGAVIEYTTGLNEVYVNAEDVLYVMQNIHNKEFGYLQSMEDLVYLLDKHGCLSPVLKSYEHYIIADYLFEKPINVDTIIKLCDKVKANKFNQFLKSAKTIINKYGLYVPDPKIKHYDRRRNNEKNLAETFDLKALSQAAYRLNVYEDNLYLDVADAITNIVFRNSLESLRYNLNMLYDDYLSDYITDYEYDLVAYCCKVASYMLNYCDIGVYGIEIFTRAALDIALEEYGKGEYTSTKRSGSVVENIFDKATYNGLEYSEQRMTRKQEVSDEDVEDFKRYL